MSQSSVELVLVTPLFMKEFFLLLEKWGEKDALVDMPGSLLETARRVLVDPGAGQAWLIRVNTSSIGFVILSYRMSVRSGGRVALIEQVALAPVKGVERLIPVFLQNLEKELAGKSIVKMEVILRKDTGPVRKRFFQDFGFLTQSVHLLEKVIHSEDDFPPSF